jgi:hypothetical protein
VRVTESWPLEILSERGRDLAVELDLAGRGPVASAGAGGNPLMMIA